MSAVSENSPRSHAGKWIYALAWLPFLTVYLAAFIASNVPPGIALRNSVANLLPEVLLGVLVLQIPRWLPWPEGARTRFFATHLGLLVAFVLTSTALWAAFVGLDSLLFDGTFQVHIEFRWLPWRILSDLQIYGTLAALTYARHSAAASREQAARAARAEALRARAELEAMRSQLNPHFILNTFHALLGLVSRQPAIAEEALERLGDLLRYSLRVQREGLDEVTLRDEWTFVQTYLELERLRLGDRLRVKFDAAAEAMDCLVPSFALQTLVENAVRHAIAPRAGGGTLTVSALRSDGRLRLRVEDEGPGPSAQPPVDGQGVGLRLLRERLAAIYDGQASLDLRDVSGGTCAMLDLPDRQAGMRA